MTKKAKELYALDNYELRPVPGHEGGRNLVYICSRNGEKKNSSGILPGTAHLWRI